MVLKIFNRHLLAVFVACTTSGNYGNRKFSQRLQSHITNSSSPQHQTVNSFILLRLHSIPLHILALFQKAKFPVSKNLWAKIQLSKERMEALFGFFIRPFACFPNFFLISSTMTVFFALPFYILTLVVIYRNSKIKPLDSLFFRLVLLLGIVDILQVVTIYLVVKAPGFGLFPGFYRFASGINFDEFINRTLQEHTRLNETTAAFGMWHRAPANRIFPTLGRCALTFVGGMQYFGITVTSFNRFTAMYFWNSTWQSRVPGFSRIRALFGLLLRFWDS